MPWVLGFFCRSLDFHFFLLAGTTAPPNYLSTGTPWQTFVYAGSPSIPVTAKAGPSCPQQHWWGHAAPSKKDPPSALPYQASSVTDPNAGPSSEEKTNRVQS